MRSNLCAVSCVVRKVCLYESQRDCAQNYTQTFSVYGVYIVLPEKRKEADRRIRLALLDVHNLKLEKKTVEVACV